MQPGLCLTWSEARRDFLTSRLITIDITIDNMCNKVIVTMQIATNYTVLVPFYTFFQFRLEQHETLKIKYHSKLYVHRLIDFIFFFYIFNCLHVHIHYQEINFQAKKPLAVDKMKLSFKALCIYIIKFCTVLF